MKYLLKTEVNGNGNKVFSKERRGKDFVYLAKDENNNVAPVDKNWILQHQKEIVNLGVSGDSIYPVEIENEKAKKTKSNTGGITDITIWREKFYSYFYGKYDYKTQIGVNSYNHDGSEGIYENYHINQIKVITDKGILPLHDIRVLGNDDAERVKFEVISPSTIKHFTYRTSWDKVTAELKKNKICIYSEKKSGGGTEEVILLDDSFVNFNSSKFIIKERDNRRIEATHRIIFNVKSRTNETLYIDDSVYFEDRHVRDGSRASDYLAKILDTYKDDYKLSVDRKTAKPLVIEAINLEAFVEENHENWFKGLDDNSLKKYYEEQHRLGKIDGISRIPIYTNKEIENAHNRLKEIQGILTNY